MSARAADGNLFADAAPPATGERFEVLRRLGGVEVERIVSSATPDPAEYRQPHDEWVVLLSGSAELVVDGATVRLAPGDHLWLPAHTPHQVTQTAPGTVWLALHAKGG